MVTKEDSADKRISWLMWAVSFLLVIISMITTWNVSKLGSMTERQNMLRESLPKEFVMIERYKCDQQRIEKKLDRIIEKLDEK